MGWTRGRVIGRGSTATVYTATASTTPSALPFAAVKSSPLSKSNPLQSERVILSSIPASPYIVSYLGHSVTTTAAAAAAEEPLFNLFVELAPGGTIADEIARRRRPDGRVVDEEEEERTVRFYTWRILKGLEHLHAHGIVHRDVKASNVLLCRDGPKVADLGCAAREGECARVAGTPMYMAPEAARGEEQGTAADVWSVGCLVVEMMTGESPWEVGGEGVMEVMYRIGYGGGERRERPEVPGWVSEEGRSFVEKCLRRTASERWTVKELLHHPFVRGFCDAEDKAPEELESEEEDEVELDCEEIVVVVGDKCGGIIENWMSPTSVLEQQGIWSSLEEDGEGEGQGTSSMASVRSRIMGLSSSSSSSSCGSPCFELPSWESDGDCWVTVRRSSNR